MGFPSTASDYIETRISLDQQLINQQRLTSCGYHVHISGKGYSRGAACGRGITYCLQLVTADMCNRRGSDIGITLNPT